MAVNLHQPSVYALFDGVPVPLLTFNVMGQVTYANAAAKSHPANPVASMSGAPEIKKLVGEATLGQVKLPHRADMAMGDGTTMSGRFLPGPAGLDVAFMADSGAGAGAGGAMGGTSTGGSIDPNVMGLKDLVILLRHELGGPLDKLATLLKRAEAHPSPLGSALVQVRDEVGQRLARFSDLIQVFGDEMVVTQDRIELLPVLRQVVTELAPVAQRLKVEFNFPEPPQTLPPIYGSQQLIRRAMYEAVHNAVLYSRQEVDRQQSLVIDIRMTMSGGHVLVLVRNRGATDLAVNAKVTLTPFPPAATTPSTETKSVPRLGLPLVQRIIALHGGSMRLSDKDSTTVQLLMELPTGAPQRSSSDMDAAQAQRYAEDLAKLMNRRKKKEPQ